MLIDRTHKPWFVGSVLLLASAASAYWGLAMHSLHGPSGGSVLGLIFGIVGSLLMIFAALLAVRKRLPTWRVGSAQFWLRGHLWLGTLGFVLVLFHSGFHWGGLLEQLLWVSFGLVVVTGFAGVVLQQVIPRLLTTRVPLETMVAQIPFLSRTMQFRADQLVANQAGVLDVDYESLKPFAEEALKQQRVLKRESDFPKELAKVYANVPLPEADAKKMPVPAPADIVSTKAPPTSPLPQGDGGPKPGERSPDNATPSSANTISAALSPAAKPKSPLELMREKSAAKGSSTEKPTETHEPLTSEKPVASESSATEKPMPPVMKKPVAAAPKAPAKVAAPVPPALLAEHRDFHIRVVRPFLSTGRSSQYRLDDGNAARRVFAQLRSDLPAELHDSLQELEDLCEERRQFNTQLRLHRWLHWWLILHIPPSIALLVLFVAHVIVSLRVVPFGR
jgi:hypothetical protein